MKILVACSGIGGHLFAALGFLESLEVMQKDLDILLVVTKRDVERDIIPHKYKVAYTSITPISLKLDIKNFQSVLRFFNGILESLRIIIKFRPKAVVGFGGYASFWLVFFAWCLRIKTVIHEQNVIVGFANRLLLHFADRIAISFNQTRDKLVSFQKKLITTGNPLRSKLMLIKKEDALEFFCLSSDKFTILVMGGSLGSHKINMEFFKSISYIKDKDKLQIIHLSGMDDFDFLNNNYKNMGIEVKLFRFLDNIGFAYSASDIIICRAGALTVSEIIFHKLPCIIIPYPYARRHQLANARILTDKGCGILIQDEDLNAKGLSHIITELLNNPAQLNNMISRYKDIHNVVERSLSEAVLSLV